LGTPALSSATDSDPRHRSGPETWDTAFACDLQPILAAPRIAAHAAASRRIDTTSVVIDNGFLPDAAGGRQSWFEP
jgi:hypothetical protein